MRRTGDRSHAEAFRARVLGLISALDRRLNPDGLLEKLPGWVFVEWSHANAVRQADGTLKLSGERTETCQYYAFFTGVATKEWRESGGKPAVETKLPDGWHAVGPL